MCGARLSTSMYSWEVVCIGVDEESEFDDCRSITRLGYKSPSLTTKSSDEIGAQMHQGHRNMHITVDGSHHELQAGRHFKEYFYARALDHDSPDDPLLSLDSVSEYKMENMIEEIR